MMGRTGSTEYVKNRQNLTRSANSYHILDIEIDSNINACSNNICDVSHKEIPLYKYTDIPDFLQGNPYVIHGYRVMLPFSLCLKSIFVWSNESINIWSHLLGFLIFLLLMVYDNLIILPRTGSSFSDYFVVSLGLLCYQVCMLCSVGFHMFCCHSERASRRWLAVDLTGISLGVIGCYLPAVHYAFYCLSVWRDVYFFIITILTVSTIVIQLHRKFFSHGWFRYRILIYVFLAGYGVLPTIHWVYLNGGPQAEIVQLFIPKVMTIYCAGVLALVFYLSKFPERFLPGSFDYIGSSHQWWHIIVVAAFIYWHFAGQEILLYRQSHQCHI
ncbi:progestin and adipoQ receptor family member 3 [Magallana gigas]|uniref:progestin and adipoQ receptor family member 3 n=1 Tax=Magallana gigas TaxID=29159 RepID=UPI00333EC6EF